jgi:chromosome segregation ATPase
MDIEQLQKRIQWIEEDRRKEKDSIALLENKVTGLEGGIAALLQQAKDLSSEITRLSAIIIRMDQYDQSLIRARVESKQSLDDLDKTIKLRIDEAEKFRQAEARSLENNLLELQKQLEAIPRMEKNLQSRVDFEIAIRRSMDELRNNIDVVRVEEEEYTRTIRLLEDGRRQDAKRIVDLQGEVNALRKRMDDQRGQTELVNTNLHKLETRLSELVTIEGERREMITNFMDKQAVTQVDRERVWKEWQSRFDTIEK